MLGLAAVPSIVMFFGCLVLPESPRWLVSRGHSERAKKVLVKLRGTVNVDAELEAMKNVCDEEESLYKSSKCVWIPITNSLFNDVFSTFHYYMWKDITSLTHRCIHTLFVVLHTYFLPFLCVDEPLVCDHSNESYWVVFQDMWYCLLCCTKCF